MKVSTSGGTTDPGDAAGGGGGAGFDGQMRRPSSLGELAWFTRAMNGLNLTTDTGGEDRGVYFGDAPPPKTLDEDQRALIGSIIEVLPEGKISQNKWKELTSPALSKYNKKVQQKLEAKKAPSPPPPDETNYMGSGYSKTLLRQFYFENLIDGDMKPLIPPEVKLILDQAVEDVSKSTVKKWEKTYRAGREMGMTPEQAYFSIKAKK